MADRSKRTRKTIERLLAEESEHGGRPMAVVRILRALGLDWDELLLALSNLAVFQGEASKRGKKLWRRRAMQLHNAMEKERSRKAARKKPSNSASEPGILF